MRNGMRTIASRVGFCLVALAVAVAGIIAPACAGERVIHIYTWSDYLDSDVIYQFEKEFNCRLAIDYFDSNESMYAKLKAGGGGYDIITPSSYMSAIMRKQKMIADLDHAKLPNIVNIDPAFLRHTEDAKMTYSVPYTRTVTGVGYNKRRVHQEDLGSWDIFGKNIFSKRMTMLNDMRETIGAALKYRGYSLNTTDDKQLAEAGDTLVAWKKNLAKFDVDEAKIGLASGEFLVIHAYNGDIALSMEENPDIDFYIPKEGSSIASDDLVIAADSPNLDLAHSFINLMLDPDVAQQNMESIRFYMPNPKAIEQLDPELRDNHAFNLPQGIMDRCEVIRDLGDDNMKYVKIWDRVKAAE